MGKSKCLTYIIFWMVAITIIAATDSTAHSSVRKKRHIPIWFPYNSCIAFAIVLVIPLKLKNRNVYMSYNFETNFYLPYFDTVQGLVPLPFAQIDEPGVNSGTILWYQTPVDFERKLDGSEQIETESNSTIAGSTSSESIPSTTEDISSTDSPSVTFKEKKLNDGQPETKKTTNKKSKQKKKKRINREILQTLLSRKKFYKMLISKLEIAGFNGEECLLRAICETAEQPNFEEHNGVLGDIVHILFTPTASRDEKLPQSYYDAILDGESGRCRYYHTLCPVGIFDFITKTIDKM